MYTNRENYVKEWLQGLRSNIRYYRSLSGASCEQLAKRAGISPDYLSRLEAPNSDVVPSFRVLCSLAYAFGVELSNLAEMDLEIVR